MAAAKSTKDTPEHIARIARERARKSREGAFQGKKFSDLNNPQKDELLRVVAMHLNLIEE